ncbi:MAG: TIM barrel protein, partial [Victivallaceae bacterium]|nr:TIM barrel protein [Victivallaceae bacterium]
MMEYPKINLAVDNCFASKRWIAPEQWMELLSAMGIHYAQSSADVECDMLYMDADYLADWESLVRRASAKTGVKIANFYSGHGTYTTLGLTHPDSRNAEKMLRQWIFPMLEQASRFDHCGMGFFCHAFPQEALDDVRAYEFFQEGLLDRLARIAAHANACNKVQTGLEQMYTPHQPPWTIASAKTLIQTVKERSQCDFYLTIDTGHQCAQRKYKRPSLPQLEEAIAYLRKNGRLPEIWLGPHRACEMLKRGANAGEVAAFLEGFPHLFAEDADGDTNQWLRTLGPWSPIIHLQQTDSTHSGHAPFDEMHNRNGVIHGPDVLRALAEGFQRPADNAMP